MATKPEADTQTPEEPAPTEPKAETKPAAHAGFDKKGKCLTCGEKIRTDSDNQVICPANYPKCPRNKRK